MTFIRVTFAGLGFALLLVAGCKSTSTRDGRSASASSNAKWIAEYKRARSISEKDPDGACASFKALAEDEKFTPRLMARLRAYEVCANEKSSLNRAEMPEWLADLSLDVSLKIAERSGDKAAEVVLAEEKSKQKLPQGTKLKWIELALQRAGELKQKERIADLLKRKYIIAPRLNPEPSEKDWLAIASDYRINREFTKAREYYEKVLKSSYFKLDDKVSALKGIRLSYKNARANEAHVDAALAMVNYLKHAEKLNPKNVSVRQTSYEAQTYLARAVWTLGRGDEAGRMFDQIEKRYKGKLSMAELYWLKGRLAEESGDLARVSEEMTKALNEKLSDGSELRDKILWYSAWNERRQSNFSRAAEIMNELAEKTESDFTRARTLYWLGKTHHEMKQVAEEKAVLERVISLDPLGYYGLLAHRHLGIEISFKRTPLQTDPKALEGLPLDLNMAEWLAQIDEREALTAMLDQASAAYRRALNQNNEAWITLFKYYAKGGLYSKLYDALGTLTPERRKAILESQPEVLFPQPWNEDVKLAALQFSVGEELIYSIMRQESAFDPRARSGADAFGLMQVLPEVAERTALDAKIAYAGMDDLYQPRTNIPIGAAHIQELLKRHKGQFILAVAAYNANENAIRGWMKTRYRGDSLEFIEEIPYEETRVYVRLVMRNLIFYSLLKSRSASIEFPSWVLKLDPS